MTPQRSRQRGPLRRQGEAHCGSVCDKALCAAAHRLSGARAYNACFANVVRSGRWSVEALSPQESLGAVHGPPVQLRSPRQ